MSTLITTGQLTLYDYNDALIAGTPPNNPQVDSLWLDTSTSPNMMKRWNGVKWDNIGELDPQYTEKIETITGNITEIEKTLGNMADDGKLDLTDRQDLVDKLIPIIGYIPSSTDTALKTAAQLDSLKKGSFAKIRESAVDAGILTTNTAYTGLATAWTNLRGYLNGLSPKPWDIGETNKKNDSVVLKATFRTHWLNYYNAEYVLATATSKNLNTAITAINNTTIPALQNASLSNSEKAAINQSLLVLTSEKTGMNGEVVALKSNPKFLSQAALDTAKSNYDAAYSSVSSAIAAVMAVPTGTLIPSNLIGAVETAILQYGEKLSVLQREIQNAQTAISNKISADASAELSNSLLEYVDKTSYGQDIATIQSQVDGAITTWFGDSEPTLLKAPAKDWNTNLIKDTHLGDLYYDNISGYGYRFGKEGTLYRWIRIVDADVVAALSAAQNAQDTADGKRRAFYNQPTPPYDIGDLWVQGENGELMRAVVAKPLGGIYHASDWVKATKYTDDTALDNLEIGGTNLLRNSNFATGDLTGWTNNGSATYTLVDNKKCAYINTSNGIYQSNVSKDEDAFYSVSFLAKALDSATSSRIGFLNATGQAWKNFTFTTEWRKYTFTTGAKVPAGQIFHIYGQGKRFYITNVQVERGMKATDWSASPEDVSAEISSAQIAAQNYATNHITQNIQPQIDGKIESFSQTTDPSVAWTTTLDKTNHEGDIWYHPTSKETKRWNGTAWIKLEDKAALDAANLAATKMQVFIAQPKGPYYVGDLWVQGTTGDLMRCQTQNLTVNGYNASHWAKATKYTDDTTATAAATAASNAQTAANNAQTDATKANNAVSDIISDSKMTPDEKVILQREWLNIQYERNEILSQAERYAIDNASYRSVYDTLSGYLAPFFTNLTTTQNVNGETLRSNFQRYYEQRQAILDAISVAAQQKVLDLQTQVDAGPFADKTEILSGTEIFTDKADDSVVHVDIDGKSYQNAGSGKNLFNGYYQKHLYPTMYDFDGRLLTIKDTDSTAGRFIANLKPNTNYVMSFSEHMNDRFYFNDNTTKSWEGNKLKISTGSGVNGAVELTGKFYPTVNEYPRFIQIQLEEGSTATAYEPPTPSPDYPIEIHNLNDFDVVSSIGKENLLLDSQREWRGANEYVSPSYNLNTIFDRYKLGQTYTISFDAKSDDPTKNSSLQFYSNPGATPQNKYVFPTKLFTGLTKEYKRYSHTFTSTLSANPSLTKSGMSFYGQYDTGNIPTIRNIKIELGTEATPYTPASGDVDSSELGIKLYKANILLSEPLRSVGNVKDILFRDNDGLWKVERNVGEVTLKGTESWKLFQKNANTTAFTTYSATNPWMSNVPDFTTNVADKNVASSHLPIKNSTAPDENFLTMYSVGTNKWLWITLEDNIAKTLSEYTTWLGSNNTQVIYRINPTVEILSQTDQDKLNNIASYKDSNYLYTIVDKASILPEYVRDNLKPSLRATFKSKTWYQNYKRGDDLRHFVEVKGLDRAIRFGMLVDYQSFAIPTTNWLYFCKIQTNTDDFREELVDEDGSIFDYTTQREIKVPKQALDLRGVAEGTTGYLAFDTRNQLMWFIHYQRNYTYTTNQETGIIEKIPSSEYWIKWNPGKTGHNTQLVLDESVYIVGEIER